MSVIYSRITLNLASLSPQPKMIHHNLVKQDLPKRDIYFILSDMHASQISLAKHLGEDNHFFINRLKSLGFYIADNASSNYKYTILSLPSMLTLDYIPKQIKDTHNMKHYYDHNQMAMDLKNLGYQFVFITPRRYIIEKSSIADLNMTCSQLSDFEGMMWDNSLFFRLNKFANTYRKDILCGLENIKRSALLPGPKFVFAHLLSPHPPYVFNSQGGDVPFNRQYDFKTSPTSYALNKKGYLGQVQFISKQLIETVEFILAQSKTTPIIIIQGDHGFSLYDNAELSSGKSAPASDLVNGRMRVLGAYLFPAGGSQVLYDRISPINMTRGLMRFYFHRHDLIPLPDKAFWSPEADEFAFSDVTNLLRSEDKKLS